MKQINEKLNELNNFHLTLKTILFDDLETLEKIKEYLNLKNYRTITILNNVFENLKKAYDEKIDYVLVLDDFNCLLPVVSILKYATIDNIKPYIKVIYTTKDNRIENIILKEARKKSSPYVKAKDSELIENLCKVLHI